MRCPICKGGQGQDRWNQESLDKHMADFHHVEAIPSYSAQKLQGDVLGTLCDSSGKARRIKAPEAEARDSFVEAIDSMISEVGQQDTEADKLDRKLREFEVLHPIDKTAITEHAEAVEAVKRLGRTPMTLSSKLCWSWLATVLLVGVTLIALVLVTKV